MAETIAQANVRIATEHAIEHRPGDPAHLKRADKNLVQLAEDILSTGEKPWVLRISRAAYALSRLGGRGAATHVQAELIRKWLTPGDKKLFAQKHASLREKWLSEGQQTRAQQESEIAALGGAGVDVVEQDVFFPRGGKERGKFTKAANLDTSQGTRYEKVPVNDNEQAYITNADGFIHVGRFPLEPAALAQAEEGYLVDGEIKNRPSVEVEYVNNQAQYHIKFLVPVVDNQGKRTRNYRVVRLNERQYGEYQEAKKKLADRKVNRPDPSLQTIRRSGPP